MSDAIDLITGGLGVAGNIASTLINNHHNEQLIKEQNQLNLQQWNRENLYNSPSEQMKRLKVAGLNPNLMYGNGAGSLLSAPSPEMQAAHTDAPQVDPLTAAQIANIDADTRHKDAETRREDEKQPLTLQKLSKEVESFDYQIDVLKSQKLNLDALSDKYRNESKESFYNWQYSMHSIGYRLNYIDNLARKTGLESVKLDVELDYLEQELQESLNVLKAQVQNYYSQSDYFRKSGVAAEWNMISNRMDANTRSQNASTRIAELQAQIDRWDDMTTNERLRLATDVGHDLLDFGYDVYQGGRIKEEHSIGVDGKRSKHYSGYTSKSKVRKKLSAPKIGSKRPIFEPM